MRVAIYHPWVYLKSGIERTFVEIFRRSRHEWTLYTHHFEPDSTYPELRDAPVVQLDPEVSVRRSLLPLLAAGRTIAQARLPQRGEDLLMVSSEGLGDFVMARATVPAICWCHTPLKILHDPVTAARLREQSRITWAASRVLAPAFTAVDRRMWRRYRRVIANSDETYRRIVRVGLAPPERIETLRAGVDLDRYEADPARPRGDGFLVAGRIMWQKNVELAIDAVRRLAERTGDPPPLIVAGAVDEKSRPYLADLRTRAAGLPVTFEPHPTDDRLAELYRETLGLVFTAPNEDFGLVPLEAMASATPVIAVNRGGPRESVVHGRTGWLEQPTAAAFAERMDALRRMPDPEFQGMRAAARNRAEEFGWPRFMTRLDEIVEEVAATS